MTGVPAEPNCIDIVVPFRDEIARYAAEPETYDVPEVHLLGGIGSAALKHPRTEIMLDERLIITPVDFLEDEQTQADLHPLRSDGTQRDMDALVLSTNPRRTMGIEKIAEKEVGELLKRSVFGLHTEEALQELKDNPFSWRAVSTILADRFLRPDGDFEKAAFPFSVTASGELLRPFELHVGDQVFLVAHPGVIILNYLSRSMTGLRPKDREKVEVMAGHIFSKSPELKDWLNDGDGRSHLELAGVFQTLRRSNSWPQSKRIVKIADAVEIKAGSVGDLVDHEAFMLHDAEPAVQRTLLMLAVMKSRGVGIGESSEKIRQIFYNYFEDLVDGIIKNKNKDPESEETAAELLRRDT